MSRFTTPFGFHSTAAEAIAGVDLVGKRAIITVARLGLVLRQRARCLSPRIFVEAHQVTRRPTDFTGGYAPYAVDPSNFERLWDLSLKLIAWHCASRESRDAKRMLARHPTKVV
jgi:hypothetical protein